MLSRNLSALLAVRRRKLVANKEKHARGECQDCGCSLDLPNNLNICASCQLTRDVRQNRQAGNLVTRGELASSADSSPKQASTPASKRGTSLPLSSRKSAQKQARAGSKEATKPADLASPDGTPKASRARMAESIPPLHMTPDSVQVYGGSRSEVFAPASSLTMKDFVAPTASTNLGESPAFSQSLKDFKMALASPAASPAHSPRRPAFARSKSLQGLATRSEALGPVRLPPKLAFRSEGDPRSASKQSNHDQQERALAALRADLGLGQEPQHVGPRSSTQDPEQTCVARTSTDSASTPDLRHQESKDSDGSNDTRDSVKEQLPTAIRRVPSKRPTTAGVHNPHVQVLAPGDDDFNTATRGSWSYSMFKTFSEKSDRGVLRRGQSAMKIAVEPPEPIERAFVLEQRSLY